MKKDLEWVRQEILREFEEEDRSQPYAHGFRDGLRIALSKINQLDEPEVLSQEWIDKNKFEVNGWSEAVYVEDLQNLLVPKRELPVIPQFVAEWIEGLKSKKINLLENIYDFTHDENINNYIREQGDTLMKAWLDGYTVEEEQKYVVELPNPNNHMGRHKNVFLNKKDGEVFIDSANLFVNDITKYGQYALTEEEIKKDFEWAWVFAKPVEEEEE